MEDEEAVWCVLGGGEVSPHVAICPAGKYAPPPSGPYPPAPSPQGRGGIFAGGLCPPAPPEMRPDGRISTG